MAELKERVNSELSKGYELAMVLYYPNGNFFAPKNFDQQTSGRKTISPSLSLGEVREFCFRENSTEDVYSLDLAHGSLLVMDENCQSRYTHSLIKHPKYNRGRINITFRDPEFK